MRAESKLVIGGERMGGSLYKQICLWEAAFTKLQVEKEQHWDLELLKTGS